jgi:hypothetical protein
MIGKNLAAGLLAYRTGGALTAALAILFISSIAHSATVTVNAFARCGAGSRIPNGIAV